MGEDTITSFFVALCLVCLWITATRLLNFLTESSKCYREATRVEDNGCSNNDSDRLCYTPTEQYAKE